MSAIGELLAPIFAAIFKLLLDAWREQPKAHVADSDASAADLRDILAERVRSQGGDATH